MALRWMKDSRLDLIDLVDARRYVLRDTDRAVLEIVLRNSAR
jgi:hypothetical protein